MYRIKTNNRWKCLVNKALKKVTKSCAKNVEISIANKKEV